MRTRQDHSTPQATGAEPDRRLDALLAHASNPRPAPGLSDRVIAAIHAAEEQDAAWARLVATSSPYARLKHWSAGVAACAALVLSAIGIIRHMAHPAPSMQDQAAQIAEEVLLEEALGSISDKELLSAIYSVSSGTYSVSSSIEAPGLQ